MNVRRAESSPTCRWRNRRYGATLVEVVVAMAIASFVILGFMGAIVFMFHQNAENRTHYEALQVLEFHQGLLAAARPQRLGAPDLADGEFEARFAHRREAPLTVRSHPEEGRPGEEFRISFEFTGWGRVQDAGGNTLQAEIPDNQNEWQPGRWVGSYVTITSGRGAGQIMRITSNTGDTLTVTGDLTGLSDVGWDRQPDSTSRFAINNSRTVDIEIEWGNGERHRRIQRTVYIPLGQ